MSFFRPSNHSERLKCTMRWGELLVCSREMPHSIQNSSARASLYRSIDKTKCCGGCLASAGLSLLLLFHLDDGDLSRQTHTKHTAHSPHIYLSASGINSINLMDLWRDSFPRPPLHLDVFICVRRALWKLFMMCVCVCARSYYLAQIRYIVQRSFELIWSFISTI